MRICVYAICLLSFTNALNSPQKTRSLASKHYKLVPYFAKNYVKKYCLKKDEKEEMIQYGYQGFMRACQKFDETKGIKISTYTSFWIRKHMDDYIKDKMKRDKIIPLNQELRFTIKSKNTPFSILEQYNLENWEKELLIRKYFNNKTFKSIALDLNVSRDTLRKKYNTIFEKIRLQDEKLNQ